MTSKSLAPPERNTLPLELKERGGLIVSSDNEREYGQQLSSFTALKNGKTTATMFVLTENSPLKVD